MTVDSQLGKALTGRRRFIFQNPVHQSISVTSSVTKARSSTSVTSVSISDWYFQTKVIYVRHVCNDCVNEGILNERVQTFSRCVKVKRRILTIPLKSDLWVGMSPGRILTSSCSSLMHFAIKERL